MVLQTGVDGEHIKCHKVEPVIVKALLQQDSEEIIVPYMIPGWVDDFVHAAL